MATRVASLISLLAAPIVAIACAAPAAPSPASGPTGGPGGKADDSTVTTPLEYKSYELLFTNPLCREYTYASPIATADGSTELSAKPKNVWCSSSDAEASGARESSPQHKIVEWVSALGEGDEVFLAALSFSNRVVADELCAAAGRGVKVTFVLDGPTDLSEQVASCGGTILIRGNTGGIGIAHNKLVIVNARAAGPGDADGDYMRIAFGSGNMSSGVVLHHENWHFIEARREGYFAQSHRCLVEAQTDDAATSSKSAYRDFMNRCRSEIEAPPEDDIGAYFIPNSDDTSRITSLMLEGVSSAGSVDIGVHRFGHSGLVGGLERRLSEDDSFSVRQIADDDLYWIRPIAGDAVQLGDNDDFEADNVDRLERAGGDRYEIRYAETNHEQHLLHHAKYILYRDEEGAPYAVLCGAANLTGSGFRDNFENIYFIRIPHVVEGFATQYERWWNGERAETDEQDPPIATPINRMPASVAPVE